MDFTLFIGNYDLCEKTLDNDNYILNWLTSYKNMPLEGNDTNDINNLKNKLPEFYILGFEEIKSNSEKNLKEIISRNLNKINKMNNNNDDPYQFMKELNQSGIYVLIFVKASCIKYIKNYDQQYIKKYYVGIGNKGSNLIRFNLNDTTIALACNHLSYGEEKNEERKEEIKDILNSNFKKYPTINFKSHDYFFLFGDLNIRLNLWLNDQLMLDLVKYSSRETNGNFEELYLYDQFLQYQKESNIIAEMCEAEIKFSPTYKYFIGSTSYDTTKRLPSWCDRIFYKKYSNTKPLAYNKCLLTISDHQPIFGVYKIRTEIIDKEQKQNILNQIIKEKQNNEKKDKNKNNNGNNDKNKNNSDIKEHKDKDKEEEEKCQKEIKNNNTDIKEYKEKGEESQKEKSYSNTDIKEHTDKGEESRKEINNDKTDIKEYTEKVEDNINNTDIKKQTDKGEECQTDIKEQTDKGEECQTDIKEQTDKGEECLKEINNDKTDIKEETDKGEECQKEINNDKIDIKEYTEKGEDNNDNTDIKEQTDKGEECQTVIKEQTDKREECQKEINNDKTDIKEQTDKGEECQTDIKEQTDKGEDNNNNIDIKEQTQKGEECQKEINNNNIDIKEQTDNGEECQKEINNDKIDIKEHKDKGDEEKQNEISNNNSDIRESTDKRDEEKSQNEINNNDNKDNNDNFKSEIDKNLNPKDVTNEKDVDNLI